MRPRSNPDFRIGPGLAINVGNTRVALGVFGDEGLRDTFRLSSRVDRTFDEVANLLAAFLRQHGDVLTGGWAGVASVVPSRTSAYVELAARSTGREPYEVRGGDAAGLLMDVPEPDSVGPDRIANAVAAAERGPLPCIVVDLGTATHFEVVTPGPTFAGGLIAPGVLTAADSLFAGTARLAAVEFERPHRVLGRTTRECLQSGIYYGALAQIEGLVRTLRRELGAGEGGAVGAGSSRSSKPARPSAKARRKFTVITTGGLAPLFAPSSSLLRNVVPELTLEGIALLAARAGRS